VKKPFSATTARWSVVVHRAEPTNRLPGETNLLGEPLPSGDKIDALYRLDGEDFTEDFYSSTTNDADEPFQTHLTADAVRKYAALGGITLSGPDLKAFELLQQATQLLCLHLLRGGSVGEWCKERGLRCVEGVRPGSEAPGEESVLIEAPEGAYVLTAKELPHATGQGPKYA